MNLFARLAQRRRLRPLRHAAQPGGTVESGPFPCEEGTDVLIKW